MVVNKKGGAKRWFIYIPREPTNNTKKMSRRAPKKSRKKKKALPGGSKFWVGWDVKRTISRVGGGNARGEKWKPFLLVHTKHQKWSKGTPE